MKQKGVFITVKRALNEISQGTKNSPIFMPNSNGSAIQRSPSKIAVTQLHTLLECFIIHGASSIFEREITVFPGPLLIHIPIKTLSPSMLFLLEQSLLKFTQCHKIYMPFVVQDPRDV